MEAAAATWGWSTMPAELRLQIYPLIDLAPAAKAHSLAYTDPRTIWCAAQMRDIVALCGTSRQIRNEALPRLLEQHHVYDIDIMRDNITSRYAVGYWKNLTKIHLVGIILCRGPVTDNAVVFSIRSCRAPHRLPEMLDCFRGLKELDVSVSYLDVAREPHDIEMGDLKQKAPDLEVLNVKLQRYEVALRQLPGSEMAAQCAQLGFRCNFERLDV